MRVIAVKMLSDFYRQDAYRDCAGPAKAWYALATAAQWARPADVVAEVPKASILKDGRTVFNLDDFLDMVEDNIEQAPGAGSPAVKPRTDLDVDGRPISDTPKNPRIAGSS